MKKLIFFLVLLLAVAGTSLAASLSGGFVATESDPVALPIASNALAVAESKLSPSGDGSGLTGITAAQVGAATASITNGMISNVTGPGVSVANGVASFSTNGWEFGGTGGGISFVPPPASTNSAGLPGQIAYTNNYFYVCTASNTWRRSALAGW